MFEVKYQIELNNKASFILYGEDYYYDKRVFYETHLNLLRQLYQLVIAIGFPVYIKDMEFNEEIQIRSLVDFEDWLAKNQPKF